MVSVGQDDVLRGLKKFRRLAKQDLLASEHTNGAGLIGGSKPTSRRETYARLVESVLKEG